MHDCPIRRFRDEGLVFGITQCQGTTGVALPQWFFWRDGALGSWDRRMDEAFWAASEVPWAEKSRKAVFRGAIRPSSLVLAGGELAFVNIREHNWMDTGRTRLWRLMQEHPDMFDVGLTRPSDNPTLDRLTEQMQWHRRPDLSMAEQAQQFKYVVYVEGACGWADRLKNLLAAGMVVFLQETPCTEFFTGLLVPWVHYVPVRNDLGDLVDRVAWAWAHDEAARDIGLNAAEFARTHLSSAAWHAYFEAAMLRYASLMTYTPRRRLGTRRFRGAVQCPVAMDHVCDVSAAFVS